MAALRPAAAERARAVQRTAQELVVGPGGEAAERARAVQRTAQALVVGPGGEAAATAPPRPA
ncbi:hypothetical protein ACFPA8_25915 [Streptomyces ovatisporus]|uniref:Uncharacterized protein n=1 Tax=Streptomyces ovatisporus TaxID=1128682 RepID=A0ABV9AFB9_9ACTN